MSEVMNVGVMNVGQSEKNTISDGCSTVAGAKSGQRDGVALGMGWINWW